MENIEVEGDSSLVVNTVKRKGIKLEIAIPASSFERTDEVQKLHNQ